MTKPRTAKRYTTALSKGQGMIEETLALLRIWRPGMKTVDLADLAVREGVLSRATAKRARDIVSEQFGPRFLRANGGRAAQRLKLLLDVGAKPADLKQVLLIHTCRANQVLHDFISEVYWPRYSAGGTQITREDASTFLQKATDTGVVSPPWSEKTLLRVAQYLPGCLTDFGLAAEDRGGKRELLPFHVTPLTALYLAHEVHFDGRSDDSILSRPDWALFGLEPIDVRYQLERVANGHFTLQFAGDLLRITWQYDSMEEALRGITATEL
jgi:hypothetical protein